MNMCSTLDCPSGKICTMINGPRCVDDKFQCEGLLEFYITSSYARHRIWAHFILNPKALNR